MIKCNFHWCECANHLIPDELYATLTLLFCWLHHSWVAENLHFNKNYDASVFETTIRYTSHAIVALGKLICLPWVAKDFLVCCTMFFSHCIEESFPSWMWIPMELISSASSCTKQRKLKNWWIFFWPLFPWMILSPWFSWQGSCCLSRLWFLHWVTGAVGSHILPQVLWSLGTTNFGGWVVTLFIMGGLFCVTFSMPHNRIELTNCTTTPPFCVWEIKQAILILVMKW